MSAYCNLDKEKNQRREGVAHVVKMKEDIMAEGRIKRSNKRGNKRDKRSRGSLEIVGGKRQDAAVVDLQIISSPDLCISGW